MNNKKKIKNRQLNKISKMNKILNYFSLKSNVLINLKKKQKANKIKIKYKIIKQIKRKRKNDYPINY